jgi:hypothetical protein
MNTRIDTQPKERATEVPMLLAVSDSRSARCSRERGGRMGPAHRQTKRDAGSRRCSAPTRGSNSVRSSAFWEVLRTYLP